jgi:hypothetical protein
MTSAIKLFLGRCQRLVSLLQGFSGSPDVRASFPGPFGLLAELGRVLGVMFNPVGQQHPQLFQISDGSHLTLPVAAQRSRPQAQIPT